MEYGVRMATHPRAHMDQTDPNSQASQRDPSLNTLPISLTDLTSHPDPIFHLDLPHLTLLASHQALKDPTSHTSLQDLLPTTLLTSLTLLTVPKAITVPQLPLSSTVLLKLPTITTVPQLAPVSTVPLRLLATTSAATSVPQLAPVSTVPPLLL